MRKAAFIFGLLGTLVLQQAWAVVCPPPGRATPQQCAENQKFIDYAKNELRTARQYASTSSAHRNSIPGWESKIREGEALMAACGCGTSSGGAGSAPSVDSSSRQGAPAGTDMSGCMRVTKTYNVGGPSYKEWTNSCGKTVYFGACVPGVGCDSGLIGTGSTANINATATALTFCSGPVQIDDRSGSASCAAPKAAPMQRPSQSNVSGQGNAGIAVSPKESDDSQLENDLERITERPSKGDPVNGCLKLIDKRGAGFKKAFQNTCSYHVQYTYCVEDPKSLFRCRGNPPKGEGMEFVGPGAWRAIPDWYNGGRIHWLACKGKLGEVLPMLNSNGKSGCF